MSIAISNNPQMTETEYLLAQKDVEIHEVFKSDPLVLIQQGGFGWGNWVEDLKRGLDLFKGRQFIVFSNSLEIQKSPNFSHHKLIFKTYKALISFLDFCQDSRFRSTLDDEFKIIVLPEHHWFESHARSITSNINPKTLLSYSVERQNMLDKLSKDEIFSLLLSEAFESLILDTANIKLWNNRVYENLSSKAVTSMGNMCINSRVESIDSRLLQIHKLITEHTKFDLPFPTFPAEDKKQASSKNQESTRNKRVSDAQEKAKIQIENDENFDIMQELNAAKAEGRRKKQENNPLNKLRNKNKSSTNF